MRQIELLAPAKNIECGIAAINHGADAVYIGGPKFGARKSAGNSIQEISKLIEHAHLFYAKVYVALNTILFDNELKDVEKLIHDIYKIGADAIIIQDMGILELDLPPIPLHASTQTNNRTPEQVKFLEQVGFDQIVLARELTIDQIKGISKNTNAKLECFIHGALCVSYSGQCYLSANINKRSANRGECAQPCRLPYSVLDEKGNVLIKDKHVLSLKDMNLSGHLETLIDAGIYSFKIEGRLKDVDYVKNITSFYRLLLDEIIKKRGNIRKSSSGHSNLKFNPNPDKSFSRGFTSYFINDRKDDIWNIDTPKSLGERVGRVIIVSKDHFILSDDSHLLNNGDGICFLNRQMKLVGTQVNKVDGYKITPESMSDIRTGALIFRNKDQKFGNELKNSNDIRKINIDLEFEDLSVDQFRLTIEDEDKIQTSLSKSLKWETARNEQLAIENIKLQLSKLGGSDYTAGNVFVQLSEPMFFPAKELNSIRRDGVENHNTNRLKSYQPVRITLKKTNHPYHTLDLDYKTNVSNHLAVQFYQRHGVRSIQTAFELANKKSQEELMRTKHCILYMLDKCRLNTSDSKKYNKLVLKGQNGTYQLDFDCNRCEMSVKEVQKTILTDQGE